MASEAGSINAILRLDDADFQAKMKEAATKVDDFDGKKAKAEVSVDTGKALAELEALNEATNRLNSAYLDVRTTEQSSTASKQAVADAEARLIAADNEYGRVLATRGEKESRLRTIEEELVGVQESMVGSVELASAGMERFGAGLDRVHEGSERAQKSFEDASKKLNAQYNIWNVLIGLAPLMIGEVDSLGAATVGLGLGFTAMGAAAILAFKGIQESMEANTQTGQAYQSGMRELKEDLDRLETTAAVAMLDSFNEAVDRIKESMPELNLLVSEGSQYLGEMGNAVLRDLVEGLQVAEPLLRLGAQDLSEFVQWLMGGLTGGGFEQFVNYAVAQLPQVMELLRALLTLAGNLLTAFAPVGQVITQVLIGISNEINALPLPVIAGLATTFMTVVPAINLTKSAMQILGPTMKILGEDAVIFGLQLDEAVPIIGWVAAAIAGLTALFIGMSTETKVATTNANDFYESLKEDNNVVGDATVKTLAKKAADEGANDAAEKLGISSQQLIGYMQGNKEATEAVTGAIDAATKASQDASDGWYNEATGVWVVTDAKKQLGENAQKLTTWISNNKSAIEAEQKSLREQAAATANVTQAEAAQSAILQKLSGQYGVSTQEISEAAKIFKLTGDAAYGQNAAIDALSLKYGVSVRTVQNVIGAQTEMGGQVDATTTKLMLQNDAAGLLKQSLDALNGKTLSEAQAQNSFDSSLVNMGTHVDQTGKQITFTTNSIHDMSSASVALRGQLNGQVTNLEQVAEAYRNNGHTQDETRQKMIDMRQQIIDNAVAHGIDKDAVTSYIDEVFKIPEKVPPTQIEVDDQQAKAELAIVQQEIANLHDKTINVITRESHIVSNSDGEMPNIGAMGNGGGNSAVGFAWGGRVAHMATGYDPAMRWGTDTVPTILTPGEEVIPVGAASAMRSQFPGVFDYMRSHGTLPNVGGGGMGPVYLTAYIQNPFTGEQVKATVAAVASDVLAGAVRGAAAMRPGLG